MTSRQAPINSKQGPMNPRQSTSLSGNQPMGSYRGDANEQLENGSGLSGFSEKRYYDDLYTSMPNDLQISIEYKRGKSPREMDPATRRLLEKYSLPIVTSSSISRLPYDYDNNKHWDGQSESYLSSGTEHALEQVEGDINGYDSLQMDLKGDDSGENNAYI